MADKALIDNCAHRIEIVRAGGQVSRQQGVDRAYFQVERRLLAGQPLGIRNLLGNCMRDRPGLAHPAADTHAHIQQFRLSWRAAAGEAGFIKHGVGFYAQHGRIENGRVVQDGGAAVITRVRAADRRPQSARDGGAIDVRSGEISRT